MTVFILIASYVSVAFCFFQLGEMKGYSKCADEVLKELDKK